MVALSSGYLKTLWAVILGHASVLGCVVWPMQSDEGSVGNSTGKLLGRVMSDPVLSCIDSELVHWLFTYI